MRCLGMHAVPHYKGMELCQPDRGGLCISGITKNCSWNQARSLDGRHRSDSVYTPFPAERLPAASQP